MSDLWCLRTSCASLKSLVVPSLGSAAALFVTDTAATRHLVPDVVTGTNCGLEG